MNKSSFIFIINLFILSSTSGLLGDDNFHKPFLFVKNVDQIPDDPDPAKSLALRKAYFYALLDYQKSLVEVFTEEMKKRIGNDLTTFGSRERIATDTIRRDFYTRSVIIQNAGTWLLMDGKFSKDELFDYSRMIKESAEIFSESFQ